MVERRCLSKERARSRASSWLRQSKKRIGGSRSKKNNEALEIHHSQDSTLTEFETPSDASQASTVRRSPRISSQKRTSQELPVPPCKSRRQLDYSSH